MREEFVYLVKRVYNTGISSALCRAENEEDLREILLFFLETNDILVSEVEEWKEKFLEKKEPIFKAYEEPLHPIEVAILIRMMDLDVGDLCWNSEGLKNALKKQCKVFPYAVAILMDKKEIRKITAEDIFSI